MSAFFRSIRVRLTLLYSGVLFGVAAILVAGVGEIDGIPLAAQARGDRVGQVLLVLDDKHAHR